MAVLEAAARAMTNKSHLGEQEIHRPQVRLKAIVVVQIQPNQTHILLLEVAVLLLLALTVQVHSQVLVVTVLHQAFQAHPSLTQAAAVVVHRYKVRLQVLAALEVVARGRHQVLQQYQEPQIPAAAVVVAEMLRM
jgi:hypothetical protein